MAETPTGSSFQENPTKSDSGGAKSRIPISESDSLQTRFNEVLNGESVSSFSRRCGVGESTLRNILNGALPRTDYLIAIANAGAVTVDWLATGRLPKTRAELRELQASTQPGAITGALLGDAIRTGKPFSIEQQRTLGVDDDTFVAYLSGAALPTPDFIMRFAEMTGCAIGPLLAAYDLSLAQDNLANLEHQLTAPNESELIKTYRAADSTGKAALDKVATAIRTQSMGAWFSAGQAIAEAANVFDKKK